MNIVVFTTFPGVLPILNLIKSKARLKAVVSTDKLVLRSNAIETFCYSEDILFFKATTGNLDKELVEFLKGIEPDLIIMLGFSYRIPSELFPIAEHGFFNIHFSLLPAYKGPDPIFWQLKNGEAAGGITIHRVNRYFDSGPIVMQQEIPFIPGENWGICNTRYGQVACGMVSGLVERLQKNADLPAVTQDRQKQVYYSWPGKADLTIDWETDTAQQIENLVNAANPVYGGALTTYQGQALRILEVSPVDGAEFPGEVGGEIVHHDHTGLYARCVRGELLRINVVMLDDIILSGFKLSLMGAQKGTKFGGNICTVSSD